MWFIMVLVTVVCFYALLLAIPKSLLILKESLCTSLYSFCISKGLYGYIRLIPALTNTPSIN